MTREEAIDIIRKNIPHLGIGSTEMTEALKELVPELRESDDERIRIAIRLILIATEDEQKDFYSTHGLTRKDCTDWLEKQKEQKQTDLPAGFYVTMPDGKKYYTKEMRCNGMNVKVVEPKPAEWSEEDEDMLNSCISSIEEAKENRYAYKETDGDTSYDHEIAWLKSLRPSWKPSEEQMFVLGRFLKFLHESGSPDFGLMDSLLGQLNKL